MYKKIALTLLLSAALLSPAGCGGDAPVDESEVARVNDFAITTARLREKVAVAARYQGRDTMNLEQRREVLDQEIEKELLIQEAARRGLHKSEEFRKAIEEYWERTLITDLVKERMAEVKGKVLVTEEELTARYEQMKKADPSVPPLAEVKDKIMAELRDQKERAALKQWIDDLRSKASVTVNEDTLRQMR